MPDKRRQQRKAARIWLTQGPGRDRVGQALDAMMSDGLRTTYSAHDRAKRDAMAETFIRVANHESISIKKPAFPASFDPSGCIAHRVAANCVHAFAHACQDGDVFRAPRLIGVTRRFPQVVAATDLCDSAVMWDALQGIQFYAAFQSRSDDETPAQAEIRSVVIARCDEFITQFLLNSRLAGWRLIARCQFDRCGKYFIQRHASQTHHNDRCRRNEYAAQFEDSRKTKPILQQFHKTK